MFSNRPFVKNRTLAPLSALLAYLLAAALLLGCGDVSQAGKPTVGPTAAAKPTSASAAGAEQPIPGGPTLHRTGITLRKVVNVEGGAIRLARNPVSGDLYLLHPGIGLFTVKISAPSALTKVASSNEIVTGAQLSGMNIGPDGTLYTVANRTVNRNQTQAVVTKGVRAADGKFTWTVVATTEPYPLSNTPFDHMFNGLVISPDNKWIYLNSGSRTDHGEVEDNKGAFPNAREVGLTAKIFRIPVSSVGLTLPNDDAKLTEQGFIFARGTRNAYDLVFAANGELFGVDNGPDADFPDELNWLREGKHYGFPWRFGTFDNPQQFPDYDVTKDKRLSQDFTAVKTGTYKNDPSYPKAPGPFTDPIANSGPDGVQYRADDGTAHDAATEKMPLSSFTPHRSPLGLVFITDPKMPADLRGDATTMGAFVLSWGAAGGTLTDKGQDLLHLALKKNGENYQMVSTRIASTFHNPISSVLIGNQLYVLEFGKDSAIWELTFQ